MPAKHNLNLTSNSHQDEDEESDKGSDRQDDENDDESTQTKDGDNLEFYNSLAHQLQIVKDEVRKVQNTAALPQNLSKSDNNCFKQSHTLERKCFLKTSPTSATPSWRPQNGVSDDDIYAVTAADQSVASSSLQITSIDGFFNRKRGRPPKNRFVEVYKNTQQKPQAIFTSFKLERQDLTNSATNTSNAFLPTTSAALKDCDTDRNILIEHSRYKPSMEHSTPRKLLSRMATDFSKHTCNSLSRDPVKLLKEETSQKSIKTSPVEEEEFLSDKITTEWGPANKFQDDIIKCTPSKTSFSLDSEPSLKKPKLCETTENVTVIRAAGTFYPENSIENSCNKLAENTPNSVQETRYIFPMEDEVAQNLSLKDKEQIRAETLNKISSSTSSAIEANSSDLPHCYNVFQMQQQLFAFYQQIALMAPTFSQLVHTLGQNQTFLNAANPPLSFAGATATAAADPENFFSQSKNLFSITSSLQKRPSDSSRAEACVRPSRSVTTTAEKTKNRSPTTATTTPHHSKSSFQPRQRIAEAQLQYGREHTPTGYLRFRFNEDCGYEKCGYRQHQSHFHCNRVDCQYGFCDKTRFVQHTARHERLDTLMGNDFRQYRATMACKYTNCPYAVVTSEDVSKMLSNRKSSHFHCLKCHFVCADTNKVVAHRRLHSKMEFIRLAGFRKVSGGQSCVTPAPASSLNEVQPNNNIVAKMENTFALTGNCLWPSDQFNPEETATSYCPYSLRHAHYHCLVCNCSVLSRSQMMAHKHRKSSVSTSTQETNTSPESQEAKETICDLESFKNLFRKS